MPWFIWLCMKAIIWNPSHLVDIQMVCQSSMPTSLGVELFTSANMIVRGNKLQKGNTGSDYLGIAGNQDPSSGYNWGLHAWSIIPCTVCLHLLWFRPVFLSCNSNASGQVQQLRFGLKGWTLHNIPLGIHKWHSSVPPGVLPINIQHILS